jgi:hypothetical protein
MIVPAFGVNKYRILEANQRPGAGQPRAPTHRGLVRGFVDTLFPETRGRRAAAL